jgi:hypothetical protein
MAAKKRDEAGVVAIMVALLAVVLLGVSALTVDLGQAFVKKRDIQKQTDFAALAGAAGDDLPMTSAGITCSITTTYAGVAARPTDQAIIDTAAYLSSQPGGTDITPAQLTDCNLANGEANYGMWSRDSAGVHLNADPNQLSVISQPKRVDFGFGQVFGFESVDVAGQATVEIKTPLQRTLPFYAKDGCNYGNQTVAQPTNGNSVSGILLSHPSDTNSALLNSLTTNPATAPSANVPLNVQPPNDSLVINAQSGTLLGVTAVGFFLSGAISTGPEPVVVANSPTSPPDANGNPSLFVPPVNGQITIPHLPVAVTSVEAVWYVRVKIGGQWSPLSTGNGSNTILRALPLTVGTPTLTCGQGSNAGNFGTLSLPPGSPPATNLSGNNSTDQISYNIIYGLTHGLAPFKPSQLTPNLQCTASTPGAKLWPADGTNCVDTVTGLDSTAAEQGFLTGINASYPKGLLQDTDPENFCPNNYPSGTTHLTSMRGRTINNDVLTCFFTNDTTTVSQVSSASYAGPPVIDQSIYDSPRFVSVPILSFPGQGGSNKYQILGFRPGFITDQPPDATRVTGVPIASPSCDLNGANATGECNGIAYDHGQLNSVNVVFLNMTALPNPPLDPDGGYIPYVGTGSKVPLLVN